MVRPRRVHSPLRLPSQHRTRLAGGRSGVPGGLRFPVYENGHPLTVAPSRCRLTFAFPPFDLPEPMGQASLSPRSQLEEQPPSPERSAWTLASFKNCALLSVLAA